MTREELVIRDNYEVHDGEKIWSKHWKRYLKGCVNKYGYVHVSLKCIDEKYRIFRWHRVIWYLINGAIPSDKEINHIDENKQNNHISNLECIDHLTNIRHGTGIERCHAKRIGKKLSKETKRKMSESHKGLLNKAVIAYNDDGEVIHEFESMKEAEKHGFYSSAISRCCKTGGKHKGLHWEKI